MSDRDIAEGLILEAARSVSHERIRTRIAGLSAHPSDAEWQRIHAIERLVYNAAVTVEFREPSGDE